jgi:alpha-beta hydrolase superfamily lysophospholipase
MRSIRPFAFAALLLAGCSYPPFTTLRLPEQPAAASEGVVHHDGFFVGVRGTQLYAQSWRPRGEARADVIVVHGLKDHSARYAPLAEKLVAEGFAVHAFDLRGHGRSEGIRVWVDSFGDYLGDLEILHKQVQEGGKPRPTILFGHSMGGAIAALYTITRKPALAGLVLSAGALATDVFAATVGGTRFVGALAPAAGVFQLDLAKFSRDPAAVASCAADPLVYQGAAGAHTAVELLGAIAIVQERMAEIEVPVLALHGEADVVTPPAGSKRLVETARSKDKTLKLYPGLYHDLLHEPEADARRVLDDVVAWSKAHALGAAAPPAAEPPPAKIP